MHSKLDIGFVSIPWPILCLWKSWVIEYNSKSCSVFNWMVNVHPSSRSSLNGALVWIFVGCLTNQVSNSKVSSKCYYYWFPRLYCSIHSFTLNYGLIFKHFKCWLPSYRWVRKVSFRFIKLLIFGFRSSIFLFCVVPLGLNWFVCGYRWPIYTWHHPYNSNETRFCYCKCDRHPYVVNSTLVVLCKFSST